MFVQLQPTSATTQSGRADGVWFWTAVIGGTAIGAGLFGWIQGGIAGVIFGTLVALVVGVPVCISTAIVAWVFWLTRYRLAFAVLSGALTGLACILRVYEIFFTLSYEASLALAAFLGGAGAGFAALWFVRNTVAGRRFTANSKTHFWRFSLGDMFVHFTVLTMVIAFWAATIGAMAHMAEQNRLAAIERRAQWIAETIEDLKNGRTSVSLYSCENTDHLLLRIAGMPEVREITFEQTIDLTDEGLDQLPTFPNLTDLEFRGEGALNDRNIVVLANCGNLESLAIKSSNVPDRGLKSVAEMTQLKQFRHMGQFSEAALVKLQEKLPNCIISERGWYD